MNKFEYTNEEKTYIKNKLKNYNRLLDRLIEMRDDLFAQKYREWHKAELYHFCDSVYDQVVGISEVIAMLERSFEDQSISVFEYDDYFQADKEMVKQIRKAIDHFNSKPKVNYRYA